MVNTIGSLCTGYGGLDHAINGDLTWYAENDKHAAKAGAHHWPSVPNLGDLTQITTPPVVDVVTAGFPCQPFSVAGKREGTEDERWLIDDVCRIARLAEARTLILENVGGILTANSGDAMARTCQALAVNGFSRWEWGTLTAASVGAPHRRLRWFCIATTNTNSQPARGDSRAAPGPETGRENEPQNTDSDRPGNGGTPVTDLSPTPVTLLPTPTSTDAKRDYTTRPTDVCLNEAVVATDWGKYSPAIQRWETILGRTAPPPTINKRLNPSFVEWMMGLPTGHVTGVPDLSRAQQLKILGNGVVPQQAAEATQQLTQRTNRTLGAAA